MNLVAEWPPAPALVSPQPAHVCVSLSDTDGPGPAPWDMGKGEVSTLLAGGSVQHQERGVHREMSCAGEEGSVCLLGWSEEVMGSPAGRHLLVHGAVWLPSHTRHCNPTTGCRAHWELQGGVDDCCLLQLLGIHGPSMGGEEGLGSDKGLVPGRKGTSCGFCGERELSQLCLVGVRRRVPAPPAKSRGPGVTSWSSRGVASARCEKL